MGDLEVPGMWELPQVGTSVLDVSRYTLVYTQGYLK